MSDFFGEKVAHVKNATQTRQHTCHWPGCEIEVPPARWGCTPHWYALPKDIRSDIWRAYIPGQEDTLTPNREYLEAARRAQEWIKNHGANGE
jgi:hypothetical protein